MPVFETQSAFRQALGCSKATISRYTHRPDWPISRTPPWTDQDLEAVRQWRAENLQENRAADPEDDPQDAESGFWSYWIDEPRIKIPSRYGLADVGDALEMPPEILTVMERNILEGHRQLTPDQQRQYVGCFVRFRALVCQAPGRLAGWLVGYGEREVERRIRAEIRCTVGWAKLSIDMMAGDVEAQ